MALVVGEYFEALMILVLDIPVALIGLYAAIGVGDSTRNYIELRDDRILVSAAHGLWSDVLEIKYESITNIQTDITHVPGPVWRRWKSAEPLFSISFASARLRMGAVPFLVNTKRPLYLRVDDAGALMHELSARWRGGNRVSRTP
jgi:hypothetical protein